MLCDNARRDRFYDLKAADWPDLLARLWWWLYEYTRTCVHCVFLCVHCYSKFQHHLSSRIVLEPVRKTSSIIHHLLFALVRFHLRFILYAIIWNSSRKSTSFDVPKYLISAAWMRLAHDSEPYSDVGIGMVFIKFVLCYIGLTFPATVRNLFSFSELCIFFNSLRHST